MKTTNLIDEKPFLKDLGKIAIIWFLVLIAYFPVYRNQFVYDEHALVLQNERILRISEIAGSFFRFEADTSKQKHEEGRLNRYRPIPDALGIMAGQIFGLNPAGWHLFNLSIFCLTTGIIYFIIKKVSSDNNTALAGTMLFALHPINCEVVAWVVLFGNTLWGLFFWSAFLCHIHKDENNPIKPRILSVVFFASAMLSREASITLPILIFLYEFAVQSADTKSRFRNAIKATFPYIVFILFYFLFRLCFIENAHPIKADLFEDMINSLLTIPVVLCRYLLLFFFPIELSPVYSVRLVNSIFDYAFIVPSGILFVIAVFMMFLDRKLTDKRTFRFGLLIFGAGIIPFLNLYAFQQNLLVQDRYFYISSVGISLIILETAKYLFENILGKSFLRFTFISLLVLLCAATNKQSQIWNDDISLFTRAVKAAPESYIANQNLGMAFLVKKKLDEAEVYLQKSLKLSNSPTAHAGLGDLASFRKNYETAIAEYEYVIKANIECPANVLRNLGLAYFKTDKLEKALETFKTLKDRFPEQSDGYFFQGLILLNNGNAVPALNLLESAMRLNPNDKNVYMCLGEACIKLGKTEEARKYLEHAISIDPEFSSAKKRLDALNH